METDSRTSYLSYVSQSSPPTKSEEVEGEAFVNDDNGIIMQREKLKSKKKLARKVSGVVEKDVGNLSDSYLAEQGDGDEVKDNTTGHASNATRIQDESMGDSAAVDGREKGVGNGADVSVREDVDDKVSDVGGEKVGEVASVEISSCRNDENDDITVAVSEKLPLNSAHHHSMVASSDVDSVTKQEGEVDHHNSNSNALQVVGHASSESAVGNPTSFSRRARTTLSAVKKLKVRKAGISNHGNHQSVQGNKVVCEKQDIYECSHCALVFTSKAFLSLHIFKLHETCSTDRKAKNDSEGSDNDVSKDGHGSDVGENNCPPDVVETGDKNVFSVIDSKKSVVTDEEERSNGDGDCREKIKSHTFNLRKRKTDSVVKRLRSLRRNAVLSSCSSSGARSRRENTILCDVCYDRFHCGDQKHWHMQIHMEAEVLKCDGCGEVFSQTSVLYTHISQAHMNKSGSVKIKRARKMKVQLLSDIGDEQLGKTIEVTLDGEKKTFVCDVCGKSFGKNRDYQRHRRIHTGEKPYVCGECGKGFADGGSFNKHKRIHTGEKPFRCGVCDKAFNRKWDVNRHMSVHTGAKPFPCYICGKSYSRKYEQEKHIKFHTGSAKDLPFICPICRKSYRVNSDLQKHLKTHSDDKPFQCSFCEKAFIVRRDLQRHVRSHTGEKPYVCSVCSKAFRDTCAYAQHKKIHSGVRPFKCPHCSKSFVKKDDLKRHVRVHTGERPYVCSHCGKAFGKNHDLKRHTRMHTGERPYKCTVCGKAFMRSSNLHTHMNIHTGNKPYKCTMCTRAFKGSGDLYRHIKSHDKEKAHKCSICPQSFSRASDLDRHMESHFGQRQLDGQDRENILQSFAGMDFVESDGKEIHNFDAVENHTFDISNIISVHVKGETAHASFGLLDNDGGGGRPTENYSLQGPVNITVHEFRGDHFTNNHNDNNNSNNRQNVEFQNSEPGQKETGSGIVGKVSINSHSHSHGETHTGENPSSVFCSRTMEPNGGKGLVNDFKLRTSKNGYSNSITENCHTFDSDTDTSKFSLLGVNVRDNETSSIFATGAGTGSGDFVAKFSINSDVNPAAVKSGKLNVLNHNDNLIINPNPNPFMNIYYDKNHRDFVGNGDGNFKTIDNSRTDDNTVIVRTMNDQFV